MRKFLITLSLLLSFGISFSAVAQTDGVGTPNVDDLEMDFDVEGLVSIHDRTYSIDIESLFASPDADVAEMDFESMMRIVSIQALTFDTEDNAHQYFDQMTAELDSVMEDEMEALQDVEIYDLDGFDVEVVQMAMEMPDLNMAMTMNLFAVDNHVFQVMTMDSEAGSTETLANDLTNFVLDADVQNDDVTFNEDGTSTGGVFDRMPTGDDEIIGDLTDVTDSELFMDAGE